MDQLVKGVIDLMKENIATIPLIKAFNAKDECPFCNLEREAEQHAVSFILGSAYMEDDIREKTDATGFCRHHFKMMYDYGNRLGNALILSTHLKKLNQELAKEMSDFAPGKSSLLKRMKRTDATAEHEPQTALGAWISKKTTDCYVCDHFRKIYGRYLDTFFDLYLKNEEFRQLFEESKGFCLPHFGDLIETAENKLNDAQKREFYPKAFALMQENMERLQKEEEKLKKEIGNIHISFRLNKEGRPETYLNDVNVEDKIRSMSVSSKVSPISALDFVRKEMVAQQQSMGAKKGIVMDGRDIGTTVFPNAELKIFVTATPEIRARRRYDELKAKGQEASFDEILENVKQRDYIDQHRDVSPLRKADDALLLDNTNLTIAQQKEWLFDQFNKVTN